MRDGKFDRGDRLNRRDWLLAGTAGLLATLAGPRRRRASAATAQEHSQAAKRGKPTRFQIACMTLPYARFPLQRALTGIKAAGYRYVAWGTAHQEGSAERIPVVAGDAPPDRAKELGKKCRDMGLEPLMMFGPPPESVDALKHRIRQAAAAHVAQVLTMGNSRGNDRSLWVKNFKELGPVARDHGVLVVVKQHGGNTGTGAALAEIVSEVADEGVKISYDAGNVMDYFDINPLPDINRCAEWVRSFCIKDHRNFPKDQDCGPGFGEIDHYKLLAPVAFIGRDMPLCCENIFAPLVPGPSDPEGIDALARRAREFLEVVTHGLQV
jgi:sugar phosphate isomerase/epimerase